MPDKIELSMDEKRNGWTKESLARYQKEREKANSESISKARIVKPKMQQSYRPLRWRE